MSYEHLQAGDPVYLSQNTGRPSAVDNPDNRNANAQVEKVGRKYLTIVRVDERGWPKLGTSVQVLRDTGQSVDDWRRYSIRTPEERAAALHASEVRETLVQANLSPCQGAWPDLALLEELAAVIKRYQAEH